MFDRTILVAPRASEIVRDMKVTHVNAPTDESVKLLKEFEQAAKDKITQSVSVGNNDFNAVLHRSRDDFSDSTEFVVIFALNGKRMTARHSILGHTQPTSVEVAEAVKKAIADEIASECLSSIYGCLFQQ